MDETMKKLLILIGVIVMIAGLLALFTAAWHRYCFYNVLDGSAALYDRLHRRMNIAFTAGMILEVTGAVCITLSKIIK